MLRHTVSSSLWEKEKKQKSLCSPQEKRLRDIMGYFEQVVLKWPPAGSVVFTLSSCPGGGLLSGSPKVGGSKGGQEERKRNVYRSRAGTACTKTRERVDAWTAVVIRGSFGRELTSKAFQPSEMLLLLTVNGYKY